MPIAQHHIDALNRLDKPAFKRLSEELKEALALPKCPRRPADIVRLCATPTIHPVHILNPVTRAIDPLGVAILETMMGKPITKAPPPRNKKTKKPKPVKATRERKAGNAPANVADCIVRVLRKDNPHRKGTAAWTKWEGYRDGDTVAQCFERGSSSGYLKFHVEQGFIKLESPK